MQEIVEGCDWLKLEWEIDSSNKVGIQVGNVRESLADCVEAGLGCVDSVGWWWDIV